MFVQKYDVVSALMGSLLVTTIAVSRGQSLGTAAMLTISSTVMALVRLHNIRCCFCCLAVKE